jgi:hypothetical protein
MADDDKRKKNPKAQKKTPKIRLTETFRPAAALGNEAVVKGKEAVAKAVEVGGSLIDKGKTLATEKVIPAVKKVVTEQVIPTAKKVGARLSDFNQGKVQPAIQAGKAGLGAAVEGAKGIPTDPRVVEAAGKVTQAAGKVGQAATNVAGDVAHTAESLVKENAPKLQETFRNLAGKTTKEIQEQIAKLRGLAEKGAEKIPGFLERAAVSADEIAVEVKRLSAQGGKAATEGVEKLLDLAKKETPEAIKTLRGLIDQGRTLAGETIDEVSKKAPKVAADLREAFRGIGAAPEELTTRAKQLAARLRGTEGIQVAGETPGPPSGPKPPKAPPTPPGLGAQALKVGGKLAGGVGSVALDQAFTPTDEIIPRVIRQATSIGGPLGGVTPLDFAARLQRGEGVVDAGIGALRDFANPLSLGLIDKGKGGDPLTQAFDQGQKLSPFDRAKGALGFGPTQQDFDAQNATLANEDVASTAAQATGAGLPTQSQQLTLRDAGIELPQGRGVTQGGAPAPQFEPESLTRDFDNVDAQAAAAGIDPQSRRGTASVEENQAVLDRLIARNQGLRAQQFAGSQAPAPGVGGQAEGSAAATRLAQSGGLASAFGALALSGNQLRRDAADRSRAAGASKAAQKSALDLRNKLVEISAKSQADKGASFLADSLSISKFVNDAIASEDPNQLNVAANTLTQDLRRDINGPSRGAANSLIAQQLIANTETGILGALFNFFPQFLGDPGRGPADLIASLGQGGFNNEFQNALTSMVFNESTGHLEIASPDGSGKRQFVTSLSNLSPAIREMMSVLGVRTQGAGQPLTRGNPNVSPDRPSLRSGL